MTNRIASFSLATFVTICFLIPLGGCSSSEPVSITDGIDQSAIDEYKERERQLEQEAMADMDLDDGP